MENGKKKKIKLLVFTTSQNRKDLVLFLSSCRFQINLFGGPCFERLRVRLLFLASHNVTESLELNVVKLISFSTMVIKLFKFFVLIELLYLDFILFWVSQVNSS